MPSTPKKPQPPTTNQESLTHLSSLLHLFNHRNKNQHRRSVWWRHFSLFRKNLDRHLADLDSLAAIPTTHLARAQKKSRDVETSSRIQERLAFWRDTMVPKWQLAFSQVVADGRFAVLGVVLLAVLAEVCAVVGITVELEELGQREVEKVLERFGEEMWEEGPGEVEATGATGEEDVGEVVKREDVAVDCSPALSKAMTKVSS